MWFECVRVSASGWADGWCERAEKGAKLRMEAPRIQLHDKGTRNLVQNARIYLSNEGRSGGGEQEIRHAQTRIYMVPRILPLVINRFATINGLVATSPPSYVRCATVIFTHNTPGRGTRPLP